MQLIELTCDQPSFHPVLFRPSGLTLVVGDSNNDREGSSNGVGKSLALALTHLCLGGRPPEVIKSNLPDWRFALRFRMGGEEHLIERRGDGKEIALDEKLISEKALRRWLDERGPFDLGEGDHKWLSFRSLYKRFARLSTKDCHDPLVLDGEQKAQALLRHAWLMGLDVTLIRDKMILRERELTLENQRRGLKEDPALLFGNAQGVSRPETELATLEQAVSRLRADLENFDVAEDFHQVKEEADQLTAELRDLEHEIALLRFQLNGIEQTLERHPDISRQELIGFYDGLEGLFQAEALRRLEEVEHFHNQLLKNREARLSRERLALLDRQNTLESRRQRLSRLRDEKLHYLTGRHALDEYRKLADELVQKETRIESLKNYLEAKKRIQEKLLEIRNRLAEEDLLAQQYLETHPLQSWDTRFRELAQKLYPGRIAGISIENNIGKNKLRYNIDVQIAGDESDGINHARILCLDYLLLMQGAHHTMGHLWHDNRLFAHIDDKVRARWFHHLIGTIEPAGKQYIATINTENFDSMMARLEKEERQYLNEAIVLKLTGDRAESRLLGVQCGARG